VCFQSTTLGDIQSRDTSIAAEAAIILPKGSIRELYFHYIGISFVYSLKVLRPKRGTFRKLPLSSLLRIVLETVAVYVVSVGVGWFVQCIEEQRSELQSLDVLTAGVRYLI
jgi:hypothetical protein